MLMILTNCLTNKYVNNTIQKVVRNTADLVLRPAVMVNLTTWSHSHCPSILVVSSPQF